MAGIGQGKGPLYMDIPVEPRYTNTGLKSGYQNYLIIKNPVSILD